MSKKGSGITKIIKSNKAYIQKSDLEYLHNSSIAIPGRIYEKVYTDDFVVNESNKHDFIEFDDIRDVEYFKNISCMINYDDVKRLSTEKIVELNRSIKEKIESIKIKYKNMSDFEKRIHPYVLDECDDLKFKSNSLADFCLFKYGAINYDLPEGINAPWLQKNSGLKKLVKVFIKDDKKTKSI